MITGEHDDYNNKRVAPVVSSMAQAQPLSNSELTVDWAQAQPSYLSNQVCSACQQQRGSGLFNCLAVKYLSKKSYLLYKKSFIYKHFFSNGDTIYLTKLFQSCCEFVFYSV